MKKIFFFLLLTLLSISLQAQEKVLFQDTIPFRNDLGLIVVPITFDGVEKQFAFDTGAQATVGFSWVGDHLKRTSKKVNVRSSNGSRTKMRLYKSKMVQLGSRSITKHKIIKATDSDIFSCYNIDGILGVDITQQFNWIIDYEKKILIMSPSDHYPEEVKSMHALDFTFVNRRPSVFMDVDGKRIKFLLDTGASDSDINKKTYPLPNIEQYPAVKFYSGFYDLNGVLTKTDDVTLQVSEIQSGEVNITLEVDYGHKGSKIGNNLWKEKRLFMSLNDNKLFVSDATVVNYSSSYDCSVSFDKNTMVVSIIKEGSKAWNQGIRQGDIIKSVNGKTFTDFCSLSKYQKQVSKDKKPLEFVFVNGKQLTFQKQQLFVIP